MLTIQITTLLALKINMLIATSERSLNKTDILQLNEIIELIQIPKLGYLINTILKL